MPASVRVLRALLAMSVLGQTHRNLLTLPQVQDPMSSLGPSTHAPLRPQQGWAPAPHSPAQAGFGSFSAKARPDASPDLAVLHPVQSYILQCMFIAIFRLWFPDSDRLMIISEYTVVKKKLIKT